MRLYLPVALFLLIVALLLGSAGLVDVAIFLLSVYILAGWWTRTAGKNLRVARRFVDRAYTGDEVTVDLVIRNRSRLPIPWLTVREEAPITLSTVPLVARAITLAGREDRHIPYTVRCRRRGYYTLGPATLATGDLLGFRERSWKAAAADHLTVYPRVVPLEHLGLPTRSALVTLPARTPILFDPARVVGVREYLPSDSLRHVHWTATARAGSLLVKRYEPATGRATSLVLDLDLRDFDPRNSGSAVEQAIVVAASLAYHIITRERQPLGFSCYARDPLGSDGRLSLPVGTDSAHLMALLELLARVQPMSGEHFAGLLRETAVDLPWGSTIIAISGTQATALDDILLYARGLGHAVAVIVVGAEIPVASSAPVPRYHIRTDEDLATLTTRS